MIAALRSGAAALVLAAPALAWGCPQCAGREDGNGAFIGILIGSMIALPFGVTAIVLRIIRRQSAAEATTSTNP